MWFCASRWINIRGICSQIYDNFKGNERCWRGDNRIVQKTTHKEKTLGNPEVLLNRQRVRFQLKFHVVWNDGALIDALRCSNDVSNRMSLCCYPPGIQHSHGKSPFVIGKPSISMGHLYHGYVSHNQRVNPLFKLRLRSGRSYWFLCLHGAPWWSHLSWRKRWQWMENTCEVTGPTKQTGTHGPSHPIHSLDVRI